MKSRFCPTFLLVLLAAGAAQAQNCAPAMALLISNITTNSATVAFTLHAPGTIDASYAAVSYSYVGGALTPAALHTSPVQLTGLPPASQVTVQVTRICVNPLGASPPTYSAVPVTLTFTTAGPLATHAGTEAGALTLAPNPAHAGTTLTVGAPLSQPAAVLVVDALGRVVRRQTLPARAATAALDVAGLPAGLYLVRCADATTRLAVE